MFVFVFIFLLLGDSVVQVTGKTLVPHHKSRHSKIHPSQDLEIHFEERSTQIRFGAALYGMALGAVVGSALGSSALTSSGGDPDGMDFVGDIWAGGIAGAFVGYRTAIVNDDSESPSRVEKLTKTDSSSPAEDAAETLAEQAKKERLEEVGFGFQHGMVAGVAAGAFAQMCSGSSDEGGSSTSSPSSASSSQNDDGGTNAGVNGNAPTSSVSSQRIPMLHYAVAGATSGMVVTWFKDRIMEKAVCIGEKAYELRTRAEEDIEKKKTGKLDTIDHEKADKYDISALVHRHMRKLATFEIPRI